MASVKLPKLAPTYRGSVTTTVPHPEVLYTSLEKRWLHALIEGQSVVEAASEAVDAEEDGYLAWVMEGTDPAYKGATAADFPTRADPRALTACMLAHPDIRRMTIIGIANLAAVLALMPLDGSEMQEVRDMVAQLQTALDHPARPRSVDLDNTVIALRRP
jgi:hypothetical protein